MSATQENRQPTPADDSQVQTDNQTAEHADAVLVAAGKLRDVAERMERFMAQQISRIETEIERSERAAGGGQDAAESESQRTRWEKERDNEIRRLREEGQLLSEAWERFEAEQRRLLSDRGSLQIPGGLPLNSPRPAAIAQPTNNLTTQTETNQNTERKPSSPAASREEAVRQFQHLKREIGKHNRHR